MKTAIIGATVVAICLLSTSSAQEVTNREEYGTMRGLVSNGTPHCHVATETDIFTDEESHAITCGADSLLEQEPLFFFCNYIFK